MIEKVNITFKSGTTITLTGEDFFDKIAYPAPHREGYPMPQIALEGALIEVEEIAAIVKL